MVLVSSDVADAWQVLSVDYCSLVSVYLFILGIYCYFC